MRGCCLVAAAHPERQAQLLLAIRDGAYSHLAVEKKGIGVLLIMSHMDATNQSDVISLVCCTAYRSINTEFRGMPTDDYGAIVICP